MGERGSKVQDMQGIGRKCGEPGGEQVSGGVRQYAEPLPAAAQG